MPDAGSIRGLSGEGDGSVKASDKFGVVGYTKGATPDDDQFFRDHPNEGDRLRPVNTDDVEAPSSTTHVLVYEHKDFDGGRTGHRHRMFLRRAADEK